MKDEKELTKRRDNLKLKFEKIADAVADAGAGAGAFAGVGVGMGMVSGKIADLIIFVIDRINSRKTKESKIITPSRYKLLKFSEILFSHKTQKEVFLVTMADWDEEICQVLKENKNAGLFMINIRNSYAFLMAMGQKSPLGDLIEFIRKFAK